MVNLSALSYDRVLKLFDSMDCRPLALLSKEFSGQDYRVHQNHLEGLLKQIGPQPQEFLIHLVWS